MIMHNQSCAKREEREGSMPDNTQACDAPWQKQWAYLSPDSPDTPSLLHVSPLSHASHITHVNIQYDRDASNTTSPCSSPHVEEA